MKIHLRLCIYLFASLLAIAGCTKKVDDKDTSIYLTIRANVKGLDPIYISDMYSNEVAAQIHEPLLTYHYLKRPAELIPNLTESMPTASKDGLTHTFKLKKGIRFQDDPAFADGKGRELVAQDFIYSWKRLADPRNTSDGYWVFENRIVGLDEWREKVSKNEADYDTPIEGLQTPDSHTIVIKLKKPYYQLYYVLAMVYTAPVPKEAIDKYGKEFTNKPVGTGPYKLKSWTRGSKIELVKNDNWRGETYPTDGLPEGGDKELLADAGKPLPFSNRVVFYEIPEDQPRWLNFMKGNVDLSEIPKDNYDTAFKDGKLSPELKALGMKLDINADPEVVYTAFNMLDPILGKNLNLRKAISHAIDSKTFIEKFYNGRAIMAHSIIPPGVAGYDPNFKNPYKEFDLSKAKEYLKKAGYPGGKGLPELEYSDTNSATSRQIAEFIKQGLASIGIKMKISTTSWPQFTQKLKEKKAQIWGIAWHADYPDAENFLQLLYGPNHSPGPNSSNFKNKEYDDLYRKAAKLPPGAQRTKIYQKMRDIFVRELPWVPNAHRQTYRIQHAWLHNFKRHPISNDHVKYYRIDPKQRAEIKVKL